MAEPFAAPEVANWIDSVLHDFEQYRAEDRAFKADAVAVIAADGSEFLVTLERWTDMPDAEGHQGLQNDLLRWARRHLILRAPAK